MINKSNDLPIEMGYYKSPFGQNNFEWFLNKINNIEFQMREFFKQNEKPKITTKSENLFIKKIFAVYVIKNLEKLLIKLNNTANYLVII